VSDEIEWDGTVKHDETHIGGRLGFFVKNGLCSKNWFCSRKTPCVPKTSAAEVA
jgi:hypothetical protein